MMHLQNLLATIVCALLTLPLSARRVINVAKCGVPTDGVTLCTHQIDSILASAPAGSIVRFPAGRYLTGTLHLRSHITLQIDKGATLVASTSLEDYDHYRPTHSMARYDSGAGTRNANLASDARWTRALIIGTGLNDIKICGQGVIDGLHLPDSLGEESMRGPHTILLAECQNVKVEGIHIRRAANYAILGYELQNARFSHLLIEEGWDGIHIRGGKNIRINRCTMHTGDDCIAGGYWKGMRIDHCRLNSSCNGIRMMEPSEDLEIDHCKIWGLGKYPHLTSGKERRTSSILGVSLEPGAWGSAPGITKGIRLHHLSFYNMYGAIAYQMQDDTPCHDISLHHISATRCRVTVPFNNQGSSHMWQSIRIKKYSIHD